MPILYNSRNSMLSRLTYRQVVAKLKHPDLTEDYVLMALSVLDQSDGEQRSLDDEVNSTDLGIVIDALLRYEPLDL